MKKYLLLISCLSFSIQGIAQTSDSLFTKALERYPMLEEYTIPGFPEKVLFGTLEVYEDHVAKEGKKIPIDVVVLPAKTANPATSAFTLHWGGNGDAAKNKIWGFRSESTSGRIRATRDIVLIDDRGTGASNIRCASMDSLQPYSYAFVYDNEVILECLNEVKDKVNLELYNTPAVVRDYDLVREWLGLEQLDFFGISYGVRVGLEYMRTYPENLRTLTVQGCVPPGFDYVNEMDKAIQEQLDILIQRCKEDTTCNKYYPNFKEELYEIRDRLAEEPFLFEYDLGNGRSKAITIDDLLFRRIVGHQILHGDAYEFMPLYIHRAYEGNYAPLITAGGSLTLDMPVFLSQFCPEEIDRFDYSPIHADLFTQGAIAEEKKLACSLWAEMPAADWLNEPLKGNCPILILTGEYDANTPIRMGEQVRKAFADASRHIILPYQGHASSEVSCRYGMIAQFVESKNLSTIDTTCLSSIQPGAFSFELNLSNKEFEKYVGNYTAEDPGKVLRLYKQNGVHYLHDEFSQWTGPTQLLYKGNHTFDVVGCPGCQIIFEMVEDKPVEIKRVYRETTVFEPGK